jgi:hypothetical protein
VVAWPRQSRPNKQKVLSRSILTILKIVDNNPGFLYYFDMNSDELIAPETEKEFQEINRLIKKAKSEALKHVNKELVDLYWNVGKFIDNKLKSSRWGDAVVSQLADYLRRTQPGLKGFSRQSFTHNGKKQNNRRERILFANGCKRKIRGPGFRKANR